MVKNLLECGRSGFSPWVLNIPWRRLWQPTSDFLPGKSPRTEEAGGLQSMGLNRVGHDWATKHSTSRRNMDAKIPQQNIGNPTFNRSYTMMMLDLFKDARILQYSQNNQWHTTLTNWKKIYKSYDHLERWGKVFWQNSTPILVKNSPESWHRGNMHQHINNKGHAWHTYI